MTGPKSSPIHSFGLFWRVDQINWFPGKGNKGQFQLLGRQGRYVRTLQMADFRGRRGIYILYGNHGPYYAGLTRGQTLGKRLQDHLKDEHKGKWDRFSWFGFRQVLRRTDSQGIRILKTEMPAKKSFSSHNMIKEMEALLIKAMALANRADSKFVVAEEWHQVRLSERAGLLATLKRR